ncbi:MAG: Sodium/glucose cotransporter [Phycisphaerales bacterium]|nr:Sodium/glucose cotransporter [Phycisphaerales bacterium]
MTFPAPLPLAAFTGVSWAILGLYFLLMLGVGLAVSRGKQNAHEYFLGGRSLPTWALAVSIVATTLSAATFVGVPDQVYLGDISYLSIYFGTFVGVVVVGLLFVPKLYRAGTVTIYGYLCPRFGETGVVAVSCTFLVGRLLASGSRLFMAAVPLALMLFGTSPEEHRGNLVLAIAMIGVLGIFYTVKGGIRAVIWTDAIQLVLVIGTALLTIWILTHRIPLTAGQIWDVVSKPGTGVGAGSKLNFVDTTFSWSKPYTIWACLLGYTWLTLATYGVDHDFAQRFMISKSATRGALSVIGSQFITVAVVLLFMTVGVLLYVFYRRPDLMGAAHPGYTPAGKLDAAYPMFLLRELNPVFAGLAIAGFFAIAQGSMDSAINAMASSAVADLYFPIRRRLGYRDDVSKATTAPKVAVLVIGLLMVLFAVALAALYDAKNQSLLDFALGVMTFAFAGMLGVFLTALFTPRGNGVSCVLALVAGAVAITLLQDSVLGAWTTRLFGAPFKLAWPWWMPIGTSVAFAVCVAGRPPAVEHAAEHGFDVIVPATIGSVAAEPATA